MVRVFRHYIPRTQLLLCAVEATVLFASVYLAVAVVLSDLTMRLWKTLVPNQTLRRLGMQSQLNLDRIDMEDIDFYLSQIARMSPELFLELLQQAARHSTDDVMPRVRVPSLIIAGGQDRFIPLSTMRDVAFTIPGAQWVVMPDASHALPAEYPEDAVDHIRRFARSVLTPAG